MSLPNIETLFTALNADLSRYLAEQSIQNPLFVGIRTGGVWVAERLQHSLALQGDLGVLDISFHRDDFSYIGLHPEVKGSELPESIEDRHIILVDDVIMSGRTIRAAMNELFDFGRPASISLVCLLDVGRRELPIQPDLCGAVLSLQEGQHVKLTGPSPLALTLA
ncbi:MAG: hypothetical protein RL217_1115 [Pseudomonadota bacterium]|jgi:pyrimidine operon attenuation protein/uracil phosphoribosyltransferase